MRRLEIRVVFLFFQLLIFVEKTGTAHLVDNELDLILFDADFESMFVDILSLFLINEKINEFQMNWDLSKSKPFCIWQAKLEKSHEGGRVD